MCQSNDFLLHLLYLVKDLAEEQGMTRLSDETKMAIVNLHRQKLEAQRLGGQTGPASVAQPLNCDCTAACGPFFSGNSNLSLGPIPEHETMD